MTKDDIILHVFLPCGNFDARYSTSSASRVVLERISTIGILFSLKGGYFRAFYRWLERDYGDWFCDGTLAEGTRLERLLKTH